MTKRMLVDATHPEETRVVVLDGNRLEEFDFELASKKQLKGNIYLAKVTRVEPSLQAAFVEYGGNRHGFLAFSEVHPDYYRIPVADREELLREAAESGGDDGDEEEAENGTAGSGGSTSGAGRGRRSGGRRRARADRDDDPKISEPPGGAPPADPFRDPRDEVGEEDTAKGEADEEDPFSLIPTRAGGDGTGDAGSAEAAEAPKPAPRRRRTRKAEAVAAEAEAGGDAVAVAAGVEEDAATAADATPEDAEPAPRRGRRPSRKKETAAPDVRRSEPEELTPEETVETVGGDLEVDEAPASVPMRARRHYKIQEVIKRRQIMLVQVTKEERGNKGAALTTYLSLAGRYCVLMPNSPRGGGVSRKIANPKDRKRMKEILDGLGIPDGMAVILRTAGLERTKAEIKRDLDYLLRLWDSIRELTLNSTAPCLIHEEANLIKRAIRDLYSKDIDEIHVAGEDGYRIAKDFMRMLMPSHAKKVQPYRDDAIPLFHRFQVETQIDAMHSPTVQLRSGGYIVLNQTEALVAIDVNSGRSTRERNIEETAFKTNLEAADEIARQLRLRDLAGLVVIDFIDMEEDRHNAAVERRLKEAMRVDRARIQIGRISPFGLLELSRQRLRPSLMETHFDPCPHCGGTGNVRSLGSAALHLLRAIEEEGIRRRASLVTVYAPTAIALYVLNEKRDMLADIELRHAFRVLLQRDDALISPNFRIELTRERGADDDLPAPPVVDSARLLADSPSVAAIEDDQDALDADTEAEDEAEAPGTSAASVQAAEQDEESGGKRRRRRRRRRRDGEEGDARSDVGAAEDAVGAGGDEDAETGHDLATEGDEDETDTDADAADPDATFPSGEQDEDGKPRKRRRRGKRGGRRRKGGDEDGLDDGDEAGEDGDAETEDQPSLPTDSADDAPTGTVPLDQAAEPAADHAAGMPGEMTPGEAAVADAPAAIEGQAQGEPEQGEPEQREPEDAAAAIEAEAPKKPRRRAPRRKKDPETVTAETLTEDGTEAPPAAEDLTGTVAATAAVPAVPETVPAAEGPGPVEPAEDGAPTDQEGTDPAVEPPSVSEKASETDSFGEEVDGPQHQSEAVAEPTAPRRGWWRRGS